MENLKKAIGKKLQMRRLELRLTQDALADLVSPDIDRSRISEWERGEFLPSPKYRKKLLEALQADESLLDPREPNQDKTDDKEALLGEAIVLLAALDEGELRRAIKVLRFREGLTPATLGADEDDIIARKKNLKG